MNLKDVHSEIRTYCGEICDLFKPGAKVTILVRNPGRGAEPYSADLVISDDDLNEVSKALEYLKARDLVI